MIFPSHEFGSPNKPPPDGVLNHLSIYFIGLILVYKRGIITPLNDVCEIEEVYPQKPHLY